jgi:ABC-type transport system involved in cytochrome c biogenesis ATPase subunit
MKLTHLRITRLGPFYFSHEIEIDPDVTILTGSNDAGKSSTLRYLSLFLQAGSATEMDVNQEYLQESRTKFTDDQTVQVELQIKLESVRETPAYWHATFQPDDYAVVKRRMTANPGFIYEAHTRSGVRQNWEITLPSLILPDGANAIRPEMDLTALNPLEKAVLAIGFGGHFDFGRLSALGAINYSRQLLEAEAKINKEMERVMPVPSCLRFHFLPIEGNRKKMAILLRDRHDAMTPFGLRGTGVKKMITLLAELLIKSDGNNHKILLLDEPENSLHPDAQHLLREFLFNLTAAGKVQVVYATHSPSMINPMRPEQVRLLRRGVKDGKPATFVQKQATDGNFLALRTSLGISASDSLLFAPVTVIIEGDTEFKCLAPMIRKLTDSKIDGFEDSVKLLSLSHFLDGMGDSYEFLCRLAKSQGTRVVLFLDGDKSRKVEQQKIAKVHPDVPLILLKNRDEFEQLLPVEIYFDALADELGQTGKGKEMLEQFQEWLKSDEARLRIVFSKQVWRWIDDTFGDHCISKPSVMRKAVELAKSEQINAEPLRRLLAAIRDHLSNTSF